MFTLQEIELEIANLKADFKKTKTQSKKEALSKQIAKLDCSLKAISAYEAINVKDVVINGDPTKLGVVTAKEIQNQLPVVWVDWDGLTTSSVPDVLKIVPPEQLKWQWIENNYTRLYDRISCNDMAVLLDELNRLKTEEKVLSSETTINLRSSPLDDLEQNKIRAEKIIELWEDAIAFHYPLDEGFFLHNRKVVVKSYQLCKQHNLVFPVVFDGSHQHLAHPLELRKIPLGQLNIFPEDNTDPNEPEEEQVVGSREQVVGNEKVVGSRYEVVGNEKVVGSRYEVVGNENATSNDDYSINKENTSNLLPTTSYLLPTTSNDDYSINKENTSNLLPTTSYLLPTTSNDDDSTDNENTSNLPFGRGAFPIGGNLRGVAPLPTTSYLLPTTSLTIDSEFQNLLRPLTEEEYEQLEKNLIKDRCPVITVWKDHNTIIDGHHSYAIALQHNIPYTVREIELESRSAVIQWMYDLQLGRRNLSEEEKSYYRAKQYELLKKEEGGNRGNQYTKAKKVAGGHCDPLPKKTAQIVAEKTGVSEKTVKRDTQYAKAVDAIAQKIGASPQEIINSPLSRKQVKEMVDLPVESIKQKLENPQFIEPRELPELKVGDVVRIKSDRKNKDFVGYNGTIAICDRVYESCADIRIWQQLIPSVHKQFLQLIEGETVTLKVTLSKEKLKNLMLVYNNIEEAINY